jgi:hypothetical protein
MKSRTKIRMIRLPRGFESQDSLKWNSWNIGDVGYIEGVNGIRIGHELIIVLGNKIIFCGLDAVEVIEE